MNHIVAVHLDVLDHWAKELDRAGHDLQSPHCHKGSLPYVRWFIDHALERGPSLPPDKLARWVGFVQGVLAASGALDVDAERDRTRPLFKEAYRLSGMKWVDGPAEVS